MAAATPLDDAKAKNVLRQVEFYFSDSNLPRDKFLKKSVQESEDGLVRLSLICSFARMKNHLGLDAALKPEDIPEEIVLAVADVLRSSTSLRISEDGKRVGRSTDLVAPEEILELVDSKTVAASPLPYDVKIEDIESFFAQHGKSKMVALRGQDSALTEEELLNDYVDGVEESETESDEEVPRTEPAKNYINNKEALLEKLGDIAWPEHVKWIDKLTIDHNPELEIDANDDLIRESAFYTQAFVGTQQAFEKLQSTGVPFLRPPDYYAEMVKSDSHMLKVKGKLLTEKKKIEEAEERKKAREAKKLAKEVQAQKTKERAKRKKEEIESVKKWRKQRQQSGFSKGNDDEMNLPLDDDDGGNQAFNKLKKRRTGVAPGDRSGGFVRRGEKNKKRERRETKFGHGGRKGMRKQNTAESTNDFRAFNKNKFSRNQGGMKKR